MKERIVALGFFDGVHIGHGALLQKTCELASQKGAIPAVLTYSAHPSEVLAANPVKLINTTEERKVLISELYGIEDVVVKDFTKAYSEMSCESFVNEIICKELCASHVVAGFDFRFGSRGAGDASYLSSLCVEAGIGCDIVDAVMFDGKAVSSSRIRTMIAKGDMKNAERLLGHPHCVISEVTHGANLGEKIGFPTINQKLSENIQCPRFGVYFSRVKISGETFYGVTNIGVRPTVTEENSPRAETNILGFSRDVYGKTVRLELLDFMRDEIKFESVDDLRRQIASDVEKTKRLF
ncbi:MAG: bifunctional riboflavin kinase/FAD synthetase [Oscillospiraceae bacterium]|nr:bifunctional riboflavin kinase/FAD synthetase [Oscillospiraceae bacterium]